VDWRIPKPELEFAFTTIGSGRRVVVSKHLVIFAFSKITKFVFI